MEEQHLPKPAHITSSQSIINCGNTNAYKIAQTTLDMA